MTTAPDDPGSDAAGPRSGATDALDARATTLAHSALARLRHDLQMPINAVIGHSDMLIEELEDDAGPAVAAGVERVRGAGTELLRRLDRIFARAGVDPDTIAIQDELRGRLGEAAERVLDETRAALDAAEDAGSRLVVFDLHRVREAAETLIRQLSRLSLEDMDAAGAGPPAAAAGSAPAGTASAYGGALVLVAEDVAVNRQLFQRRLERDGYRVTLAGTGQAALDAMEEETPDVVLMDISMPALDGRATLKRMREEPALRHVPVIMIPSPDEIEEAARCIELGADDYFPKDFHPALLRARIDGLLEKRRLRNEERMYLDAVRRELEIGRAIQQDFLPSVIPQPDGWEIAGHFQPARDVAGDFYDTFTLEDGRIALVVADVSDKGFGAALYMALIRTLIRALMTEAQRGRAEPTIAVRHVNDYITGHHQTETVMFATLVVAVLDPASGALTYVNAGHCPPLVAADGGGVRTQLDPTGPAVGIIEDFDFRHAEIELAPGEILFMYTDGVTEAQDADCSCFSDDRLLHLLEAPAHGARDLIGRVDDRIREFVGQVPDFDDITMLGVCRRPNEA